MPTTVTYPGVYIEEIPSGVRTITGVATSITAFIGAARKGPTNKPVRIQSFGDFERQFGRLWIKSPLGFAVKQFFDNGGTDAIIVRIARLRGDAAVQAARATADPGGLNLEASSEGVWGDTLSVNIEPVPPEDRPTDQAEEELYNLVVRQQVSENGRQGSPVVLESFLNLSSDRNSKRFVQQVLEQDSLFVRVRDGGSTPNPPGEVKDVAFGGGKDGDEPTSADYIGDQNAQTGYWALEDADLFNMLVIPPNKPENSIVETLGSSGGVEAVLRYCQARRAMFIVDAPIRTKRPTESVEAVKNSIFSTLGVSACRENAAVYFPYIKAANPLKENRLEEFPPAAAIAGVFARTDALRGVWKAPAGIEATIAGVRELSYQLTDEENGLLNPYGVNCLRTFPVYGNVVWGARTMAGADQLASEWKYVPVRRLALFMEESLYRGTQWVVFEPNDEPLWARIRLNIGSFMNNLFRQGAFQGTAPREAYFVKCDSETTTQYDIDRGIVNIVVGYAPLKPAEFVVIKFQQITREAAT